MLSSASQQTTEGLELYTQHTTQSQHALSDKCRVCWETSSPRSSQPLVEYAGMPAGSSDISTTRLQHIVSLPENRSHPYDLVHSRLFFHPNSEFVLLEV